MTYRREIDGLRAVAVVSVILFHYFPSIAPGGFAGVDVFFVISGFLISGIIMTEIDAGRFSFWNFYARRARRILPALFVVCVVTFVVCALLLPPWEFSDFALSVIAAMGFVANIHYNDRTGYFDVAAEDQPLLHTWSLAVEEQFYIIWPFVLLLLAATAPKRLRVWLVLAIVCVGLIAAEIMTQRATNFAFFMLPARLWELALGALVFFAQAQAARVGDRAAQMLSAGALAILIGALVFIHPSESFPGLGAAPVCLATALLIAFSGRAGCLATAALGLRPMVGVGLISYSLYLWHWPLIVVFGIIFGPPQVSAVFGLLALSFACAWLSWRFIEQPIRKAGAAAAPKPQIALSAAAIAAIAAITLSAHLSGGWPWRAPEAVLAVERDAHGNRYGCGPKGFSTGCAFGVEAGDGRIDILLIGDSHAQQLMPYLDLIARERGWTGRMIAKGGCPPLRGIDMRPESWARDCGAANKAMYAAAAAHPEARFIVVAGRWDYYVEPELFEGHFQRRKFFISDAVSSGVDTPNLRRVLAAGLTAAVEHLTASTDAKIVLVQQAPVLPRTPLRCVTLALFLGESPSSCDQSAPPILERLAFSRDLISDLAKSSVQVLALDPLPFLCGAQSCPVFSADRILYSDPNHISTVAAQRLFEAGLGSEIFGAADRGVVD